MTATWNFTDLEFVVLWERHTDDALPAPFVYTCRYDRESEYERAKFETWERLRIQVGRSFEGVLETVSNPEAVITVCAWCDHEMENPKKRLWVHAVRSGAQAYVLTQLPGETIDHSGGFTVVECAPRDLAEAVVRTLPAAVPAGRQENITIITGDMLAGEHHGFRWARVSDDGVESVEARSLRFFRTPATTTGTIRIRQGRSMFGSRGMDEELLLWRDVRDDGRYVIPINANPIAMGVGTERLSRMVDTAIELMLERAEDHWETAQSLSNQRRHLGAAW
ncbi:ESX secretion-associated protein EspG [Nocardia sp. NPDC049149]|uniref:ESX secretion-associated protein EspG n=1 Tax=Nocardia sp. NPDC049149 TaxID=3364315 RepID=UPI0037124FBB